MSYEVHRRRLVLSVPPAVAGGSLDMKYTAADWAEKKKLGIARYLLVDGILFTGGPFAVVMQVIGFFAGH